MSGWIITAGILPSLLKPHCERTSLDLIELDPLGSITRIKRTVLSYSKAESQQYEPGLTRQRLIPFTASFTHTTRRSLPPS